MARPRVLDDTKKREICALVQAGMSLRKAARYVDCHVKTIRRERDDDAEFDQRMRRAEMAASLAPLEAMRRAAGTHWRAAAWMIERQDRKQERRHERQRAFTASDLERLAEKVTAVVRREMGNPLAADRVREQIDALFHVSAMAAGTGQYRTARPPLAHDMKAALESVAERIATRQPESFAEIEEFSPAYTDFSLALTQRDLARTSPAESSVPSGGGQGTKRREFCPLPNSARSAMAAKNGQAEGQNSGS